MKAKKIRKPYKKIALALSLCALILWGLLGTSASLAWFSDESEELTNVFHFADFKLEVSHRLSNRTWERVDETTHIFDDEALYEPGYVQVVYLKVENKGDRPFTFHTAMNVVSVTLATNGSGEWFSLQDYLRFGLVVTPSEAAMDEAVADRETASAVAVHELADYATETAELAPGGVAYITLIVRMPEEVDNVANYDGDIVPKVELGIIVKAEQLKN